MRPGIWQIVHTNAGWHVVLRGANGETVLTSEVYTVKKACLEAISLAERSVTMGYTIHQPQLVDQRTEDTPGHHWFYAQCEMCGKQPPFHRNEDRWQWVGQHRVTTGHTVSQWEETT